MILMVVNLSHFITLCLVMNIFVSHNLGFYPMKFFHDRNFKEISTVNEVKLAK